MLEWKLEIEMTQKMTRTSSLAQKTKMAKPLCLVDGALSLFKLGIISW